MPSFTRKPLRQVDGAPPVIIDDRLPKMAPDTSEAPARARGVRMNDQPKADRGGRNRMKPVPATIQQQPGHEMAAEFGDQIRTKKPVKVAKSARESYLRLHFHVEDSQVSLVDIREVEGPLTMPRELLGVVAYEITLGSKRIGVGSVADVGIIRGFPRPDADPSKEGHSIIELPSYDFHARVPKQGLTLSSLRKMQVSVFRIKAPPSKPIDTRPLAVQFSNNLREVARFEGIRLEKLPPKLKLKFKNVIR